MEINEKLVEEIAGILNQWRKCGRLERTPDIPEGIWRKDCPDIFEITEEESAELLIARTLKAVVDGELDEILGVVGRTEIDAASHITSGLLAFFQTWVREAITQKGAKILIALSPFPRDPLGTGTGKEEEK